MAREIMPKDLKTRLDTGEDIEIVDVREDWELAVQGQIDGAIHIPMNDIPNALDQIGQDKTVVIMCHFGQRSDMVADWLEMQGYENVYSLGGGIDRWMREVGK